jgi:hypothetical protein
MSKIKASLQAKIDNSELRHIKFTVVVGLEPSAQELHVLLVHGILYRGPGKYQTKSDKYTPEDLSLLRCVESIY